VADVLLAVQERAARLFIADNLQADGHRARAAENARQALVMLAGWAAQIVVCDLGADLDSLELIDAIRGDQSGRIDSRVGVLALCAGGEIARVRALGRGADAALPKPAGYPELRAVLEAVLRRAAHRTPGAVIAVGALRVDAQARRAWVGGRELKLSRLEFELLGALARQAGRVCARGELLEGVWGYPAGTRTRTLDSHACRLRAKLRAAGAGEQLECVWGVGWRLRCAGQAA